jgi:hypothetical protein
MKIHRSRLAGAAATTALLAATTVGVSATPASAATYTGRSDSCPAYPNNFACGSATSTFYNDRSLINTGLSVKDTKCNGSLAIGKLRVYFKDNSTPYTRTFNAYTACGAGYRVYNNQSPYNFTKPIKSFIFIVDDGLNAQVKGNEVDNPFT